MATFPWLTAMLATKQYNPVGPALDQGCWGRRAMDVRHAWSAHRRESDHGSGRSGRSREPEAQGQVVLKTRETFPEGVVALWNVTGAVECYASRQGPERDAQ